LGAVRGPFESNFEFLTLQLKLRDGVLPHQVDDGLDVFQVHSMSPVDRTGFPWFTGACPSAEQKEQQPRIDSCSFVLNWEGRYRGGEPRSSALSGRQASYGDLAMPEKRLI
jgi:hypothetical protein